MSNTVKEEPSSATFVTIVFIQILTRQLRLKLIGSPDLLTPRKMPTFFIWKLPYLAIFRSRG